MGTSRSLLYRLLPWTVCQPSSSDLIYTDSRNVISFCDEKIWPRDHVQMFQLLANGTPASILCRRVFADAEHTLRAPLQCLAAILIDCDWSEASWTEAPLSGGCSR